MSLQLMPLEIIEVHKALHDPERETVDIREQTFRIERVDDDRKLFAYVTYENEVYVTQNRRKSTSSWTRWVNRDPATNMVTWITSARSRNYLGRVKQPAAEGVDMIEVRFFHPESAELYGPMDALENAEADSEGEEVS